MPQQTLPEEVEEKLPKSSEAIVFLCDNFLANCCNSSNISTASVVDLLLDIRQIITSHDALKE